MPRKKKKIFILDTNVILHDSSCIHNFQENDIILPMPVLEELDHFKRGNQVINHNAREFVRTVDTMLGKTVFSTGYPLGEGKGTLKIVLIREMHPEIKKTFREDLMDHRILSIARTCQEEQPSALIILVTKDVNLRVKAKALGIRAEDYTTDQVKSVDHLYSGKDILENFDDEQISALYKVPFSLPDSVLPDSASRIPNKYYILRNYNHSALARHDMNNSTLEKVDKDNCYGIVPRNAEQTFAMNALLNRDIPLCTISGTAGTGKTLLALASALQQSRFYRQIFLARPVVPLSNKDIGFLPGDVKSKLDPYMQPLWDNLKVIQNLYADNDEKSKKITAMITEEKLLISPLAYIRGRSLQKIYFIVDEAQNLTPHEVKTIITRAGEGTKLVFTGDIFQIDHPYLDSQSNGLTYLIEKMQGQPLYAHVNLEKGERSPLAELAANLL